MKINNKSEHFIILNAKLEFVLNENNDKNFLVYSSA